MYVLCGVSVCVCVFDTIIFLMQNKSVCLYCASSECMLVLLFYISYTPTRTCHDTLQEWSTKLVYVVSQGRLKVSL